MTKKNKTEIKAAKIIFLGTILAAVITGAFLLINTVISSYSSAKNPSGSVNAGRDINAGRDVVVNINQHPYLEDKYIMSGVLRDGWFSHGPPGEIINSQKKELEIYPLGLANHRLGFLLSSSNNAHLKLEKLYLRLKAYAPCSLRDETSQIMGYMGVTTAAFYISEKYEEYPIKPINENLSIASWVYKGKDVDEFRVYLAFKPYVLYLISIKTDYIDLNTNQKKSVESDEFTLIDVAHGNWGGCLDINRWFNNKLRRSPVSKNYDDGIPYDIYQLLSADFSTNPGLMNVFLNNKNLIGRRTEVKAVVNSRPENSVFQGNYSQWVEALDNQ